MTQSTPPMQPSDEATKEQLDLAREQGEVMGKALNHMLAEVADDGQEKKAGPYLISYAIEDAEGMYQMKNGELKWQEPEDENVHVEIAVRDAADGRFVPNLNVHVRLIDSRNNDVGYHRQPFIWHPWLYHYGRNWQVPGDGDYRLHVHVEA
ncbi:MAG: iron transporter, partial [Anaerolineales bacterium]|nr:iron transporter [Anaerolineales bacterium]